MSLPTQSPEPLDETPIERTSLPPIRRSDIFNRLLGLCLKEFREILRDRRTIVTLIAMPILVYPLLSLVFSRFVISAITSADPQISIVAFQSEEEQKEFLDLIGLGNALLNERHEDVTDIREDELRGTLPEMSLHRAISEGLVDIAVYRDPNETGSDRRWKLRVLEGNPAGTSLERAFSRRLDAVNQDWLEKRLGRSLVYPAEFDSTYVQSETAPAISLASFIPLVLLLMTITGAVYPAIDLTAGERERGTLEALIAAPIPRVGLLIAKYVTVVFIAMLTAVANLAAMLLTIYVGQLESLVFGNQGLTIDVVVQVFGLLVLFAAFFSAILLAVTSFARSFKEAQAYLIPLMLLTIAPGILSLSPTLTLEGPLAATPLVNITLMARDIFEGSVDPAWGLVVIATTTLYALTALAIAAQIFGTDAVLYGSSVGWKEFLSRPTERANAASVSAALSCLACLFICFFLGVGILGRVEAKPLEKIVMAGAAQTLIFLLIPLIWAAWLRLKIGPAFSIRGSAIWMFALAIVLGLSIWTMAHELVLASRYLGWFDLEKAASRVQQQLADWKTLPVLVPVFAFGILPAVSEELFFRGLLFRALILRWNAWSAILISAFAFGAFHVVSGTLLTPERFLPSLFAGLILGIVAWRSKSVLPGMLLHAIHNSGLLLLTYYQSEVETTLKSWNMSFDEAEHLPTLWLVAGAGVIISSLALMIMTRPRSNVLVSDSPSQPLLPTPTGTNET